MLDCFEKGVQGQGYRAARAENLARLSTGDARGASGARDRPTEMVPRNARRVESRVMGRQRGLPDRGRHVPHWQPRGRDDGRTLVETDLFRAEG